MLTSQQHQIRPPLARVEGKGKGQTCYCADGVSFLELFNFFGGPSMEPVRISRKILDNGRWVLIFTQN
jgi:hypothetical protein